MGYGYVDRMVRTAAGFFIVPTVFVAIAFACLPDGETELPLPVDSDTITIGDDCVVKFDRMRRVPRWVFERLTVDDVTGPVLRTDNFFEPMNVPIEFRPSRLDYRGSGYDRGHAAPAADFRSDQQALNASFNLANVFPQHPTLNRGLWAQLEEKTRDYASENGSTVYVATVPIWRESGNGRKIAYETIGENRIHCPSHVGKAVLVAKSGGYVMKSWVLPNADPGDGELSDFEVSTDDFERMAGVDVWSHLGPLGERMESAK